MWISGIPGGTELAFGFGGPADVAIVAVVVLILFGSSKLGTMGKSLGEGIREFKKATREEDEPAVETKKTTAAAQDEEKQQ